MDEKPPIGIVMDPIEAINIKKDSSFAMLLEAQRRGHPLWYMTGRDLWLRDGQAYAHRQPLTVMDDPGGWFRLGPRHSGPLAELAAILMRKDPPFDMQYVQDTYVLERAENAGVVVVNRPRSLRDCNEKTFTAWFPECAPPSLIASDHDVLKAFVAEQKQAIVKPLDGMGGESIFRVSADDLNLNVVLETVSQQGRRSIMAQRYIPEINAGDKRILLIDGKPIPYALARVPADDDFRGNLARGGKGHGLPLSERDRWICAQVGPALRERGVLFAGIDVIGDYLTEINVTSPTCIRELDAIFKLNIAAELFDAIDDLLAHRTPSAREARS